MDWFFNQSWNTRKKSDRVYICNYSMATNDWIILGDVYSSSHFENIQHLHYWVLARQIILRDMVSIQSLSVFNKYLIFIRYLVKYLGCPVLIWLNDPYWVPPAQDNLWFTICTFGLITHFKSNVPLKSWIKNKVFNLTIIMCTFHLGRFLLKK